MTTDEYIKLVFTKTDVFHYTRLMPDGLSPIDEPDDFDIELMKEILVESVADKLAYQHSAEVSAAGCAVCGKSQLLGLSSAETVVNRFFADTYGFDVSRY